MQNHRITCFLLLAVLALSPCLANQKAANQAKKAKYQQSVMGWCYKPMPVPELMDHCVDIGISAIEGIDAEFYPIAKQKGLKISSVTAHKFFEGPTSEESHKTIIESIRKAIDLAVSVDCDKVIVFAGQEQEGLSLQQMTENCIRCWKQVVPYAEEKGVTLILEHLNTRDRTHPMKGHVGHFASDVDHCFEMIRTIDSPNFKLLFDVYHVSVMNGDLIRRIRQNFELIGHIHTAGNPGRAEINDTQEIYYPAIFNTLIELGYDGYIAHEFIPENKDRIQSLREAHALCDL